MTPIQLLGFIFIEGGAVILGFVAWRLARNHDPFEYVMEEYR